MQVRQCREGRKSDRGRILYGTSFLGKTERCEQEMLLAKEYGRFVGSERKQKNTKSKGKVQQHLANALTVHASNQQQCQQKPICATYGVKSSGRRSDPRATIVAQSSVHTLRTSGFQDLGPKTLSTAYCSCLISLWCASIVSALVSVCALVLSIARRQIYAN